MPCATGSAISRRGRSSGAGAPDLSARVQAGGIRFRGMESLGKRLVEGVAAQDPAAIAACFTAGAELRALTPRGLRERTGGDEAAALIAAWFEDSTELKLVDSAAEQVADKLHVSYRFEGVELGEPYVVDQHLYCVVADGKIERADLLCSGFRPRPAG